MSGGRRGSPPRVARYLARRLVRRSHREFVCGDLDEMFEGDVARLGVSRARRLYWRRVVWSILASARGPGRVVEADPVRSRSWSTFGVDARVALRGLRRNPGFTMVAVGTLALGVGSTTAIFALVNSLLLRPVAGVRAPDELVVVEFQGPGGLGDNYGMSPVDVADLRERVRGQRGIAASLIVPLQIGGDESDAIEVLAEAVAPGYFATLGVTALVGRLIRAEEAAYGSGAQVAVISERLWSTLFARAPDVIGRTLRANRQTFEVIGVAAGGFRGTERRELSEVWVPLDAFASLRHFPEGAFRLQRGASVFQSLIVRPAEGVSADALEAELRAVMAGLVAEYPSEMAPYREYIAHVFAGLGIAPIAREYTHSLLRLMAGLSALVLLIACANVANLLLFRGVGRSGDTAVRRALGASSVRIGSQLMVESGVLALAATLAGLLVARGMVGALSGFRFLRLPEIAGVPLDQRTLFFALAAILLTPLLFGVVPALVTSRQDPAWGLKQASQRETGRGGRLRAILSALQLALSLCLLVGALLLARTVHRLNEVEIGFAADDVYTFTFDPDPQGYDDATVDVLYHRMLDRLRTVDGVQSVAIASSPPFAGVFWRSNVRAQDDPDTRIAISHNAVTPDYFRLLGIPIRSGRALNETDWREDSDAVVLNESLARELFGDTDPVGRLVMTAGRDPLTLRVVGVAADVRTRVTSAEPTSILYQPMSAVFVSFAHVLVRSTGAPEALAAALRDATRDVDPTIPISAVRPLTDAIRNDFARERMLARLLTILASLAAVLALVGLYSLVAHAVAQRTREIGIRIALGASHRRVLTMVLQQAARVAVAGATMGLLGAWMLTRAIESQVFGVVALDPFTWAVAAAVFIATTLAASLAPVRTALHVDPATTLRHD